MAEKYLTKKTVVECGHGGMALVAEPKNTWVTIEGDPILIETDIHGVAGCGEKVPCTSITWNDSGLTPGLGSKLLKIEGVGALTNKTKGKTSNGNAPKIDTENAAAPSQSFVTED